MSGKLFGTDGIRATANTFPMTPDIILKVGQALGCIIRRDPPRSSYSKVVIGKDTRLSGYMVELALTSGLNSMGVHVHLVGPLPTPGIGFLARNMRADAGIVISASHNPFYDNGIKIFGNDGFKMSSEMESEIEKLVFGANMESLLVGKTQLGRTKRIKDAAGRYIVDIKNTFPLEYTLEGLRIVLDCAHGASYKVAPAVFQELGAEVIVLGDKPNGFNVNDKVGALYPKGMTEAVVKYRADVGISLDGDADRAIMADERGQIVNGDHVLAIAAIHLKERGRLPKNTIVATNMSNFGLDKLMSKKGIRVVRTEVGDKNVIQKMRQEGYLLGGEQSGHIIFLEHSTTGDGCVAALNVLAVMRASGEKLSVLSNVIKEVPQVLINIKIKNQFEFDKIRGFRDLKESIESDLKGEGRLLVRYSGTENLVRVLVEGPNKKEITDHARKMAFLLEKSLN